MKKYRTIYVCDNCGFEHENSQYFRELIGNIKTPEINNNKFSNNIWKTSSVPENIKNEMANKNLPVIYGDNNIIITSSTLCLKCMLKMLLNIDPNILSKSELTPIAEYEKNTLMQILGQVPDEIKPNISSQINIPIDDLPVINKTEILSDIKSNLIPSDEIENYDNSNIPEFSMPTKPKK